MSVSTNSRQSHTFTAQQVWALLLVLLRGMSIKAAAESLRLPFSLEGTYGLIRRLRRRLSEVRSLLSRELSLRQSAGKPIRSAKPSNISSASSRSRGVRWPRISVIFNKRFWAERPAPIRLR